MPRPFPSPIIAAMDDAHLYPWMLNADWREDRRPWLLVDLAAWPHDQAFDPLPPVPLIGVGRRDHPQAAGLDLVLEPGFTIAGLARQIEAAPLASTTLVQVLRVAESATPADALTIESFAYAMLQGGSEHARWLAARPASAASPPGTVHLDRQGSCLSITIARDHARNAIDRAMRDDLFDAFTLVALDDGITRVRLRTEGRAFSIGADLAEFGTTRDPVQAHAIRARTLPAWPMLQSAAICDIHMQGACVGSGLELAAFAARLTASPGAWFQLPETGMGIIPGFGGTVSIPRRIGRQRAALLMLSGKRIDAQTALAWGLIDGIVQ